MGHFVWVFLAYLIILDKVEVYHLEKGWDAGVGLVSIEEAGPVRVVLKVIHPITIKSTLEQRIIITAATARVDFETTVNWNENRVFLVCAKVFFKNLNPFCRKLNFLSTSIVITRPTSLNLDIFSGLLITTTVGIWLASKSVGTNMLTSLNSVMV